MSRLLISAISQIIQVVNTLAQLDGQGNTPLDFFQTPPCPGPNGYYAVSIVRTLGWPVTLSWITEYTSYVIDLHQALPDPAQYQFVQQIYGTGNGDGLGGTYQWIVDNYNATLDFGNVFFFWLWTTDGWNQFTSHYFNITDTTASNLNSTSLAILTQTVTQTATLLLSSTSPSSSLTSGNNTTNSDESKPNYSRTMKIGMGVGLSLGIILVLALDMGIGTQIVRKRRRGPTGDHTTQSFAESTSFHPRRDGAAGEYFIQGKDELAPAVDLNASSVTPDRLAEAPGHPPTPIELASP